MNDRIADAIAAASRARIKERDGSFYVLAKDVQVGDLLDFEGDPIADPNGDGIGPDGHAYGFEFELSEVESVEEETTPNATAIVIYTTAGAFGFPPDHEIEISLDRTAGPNFYLCDICGHRHPAGYTGDCRDDAYRFTDSELEDDLGQPGVKWMETTPDGRNYG